MELIVNEVMNIEISCKVEEMQISHTSALASSSRAPNGDDKLVRFDVDLIRIKERLCGESSKLQIISIVGMGGIGKTIFARNIFDDSLIAYHFDIHVWITKSQEHHLREILLCLLDPLPVGIKDLSEKTDEELMKYLLGSLPAGISDLSEISNEELMKYLLDSLSVGINDLSKKTDEELMQYAYKSLKGRRYLIIMDDMWSTKAWDDLRRIFPDDDNGSRIVITTRLTDVAEYASSSPIHQMNFLNEVQSWNLLREKVFVEQSCPPELEKIGRVIAKTCDGLPLAITVVAGILKKVDRTQYHWKQIAQNISLAMATTDERFSKILSLSYDHLPNHLKPCFLYMGGFPEDYEISVSRLIMLWVAEGFLKPIGRKSLEEVAEEYLEDLVKRNLVLIIKKRSNGKFRFCGMHDLLRDLCIQKAREEKFLDLADSNAETYQRDLANVRRLRFRSDISFIHMIRKTDAPPVRSLLHFGNIIYMSSFVLRLRLLRVLDMLEANLDSFPLEITELYQLRYLAVAYNNSSGKQLMLPPSIYKPRNLQTFIIHSLPYIFPPLPFQIWKFQNLRHFILFTSIFHLPFAARIGGRFPVLENLQTLCGVLNFKLTSKAIHMTPNLKKLKALYIDVSEAKFAKLCLNNLAQLHQLENLNLEFANVTFSTYRFYPASYALPPNLKKLTLKGCRPPSEDMSIIGLLPNLEVLKLHEFSFVEGHWESNEGEFPRLKFLLMEMSNLVCWRAESNHFPCLQHLIVRECPGLKEIPPAIGDIMTLLLIEIGPYSKPAADSALLIQEEQRSLGNDFLQVRLH